jgi:hypothetical protein
MSDQVNPAAPHFLPWFVTAPGETDVLYVVTASMLVVAVLLIGVMFFWLHSLPERMGHKKLQFELVTVLGLISLFTGEHIYWIIAVVLAVVDVPDFVNPLRSIARSAEKLAGLEGQTGLQLPPTEVMPADSPAALETAGAAAVAHNTPGSATNGQE